MHKELLKIFESSCKLPESLLVQLPFKLKNYLQSFMLPHELFANLYLHFPSAWQKIFTPQGPEQLQTFWARFRHHPSMQGHEVLSVPGFDSCCIPCNFHGDAAPVVGRGKVWTKMLLVLSWTGCLAEGNSQETCNLIWAVPRQQTRHTKGIMRPQIHDKKSFSHKTNILQMVCFCPSDEVYETFLKAGPGGTLDEAFTIIAWSFNALMPGKWPSQAWTGRSTLE